MNDFSKLCPDCGCKMNYVYKSSLMDSIRKNRKCVKCSRKNPDVLLKISKYWFKPGDRPRNADSKIGKKYEEIYGNEKAKEIKSKMSAYERTKESNNKRSKTCRERECGKYNKGKITPVDVKIKISEKLKKRIPTDSHKNKIRISHLKRIQENLSLTGKKLNPNFNKSACQIFDKISKANGIKIQHALNGGEFHIKELGYWVDGYDKDNNVVYEYDEKRHFDVYGNLKQKDVDRHNQIINFLNCKIIRIKYNDVI